MTTLHIKAVTGLVRIFVNRHSDYRAAIFLLQLPHRTQMLALLLLSAWTDSVPVHGSMKQRWCNLLRKAGRTAADKPDRLCCAVSEGMGCS